MLRDLITTRLTLCFLLFNMQVKTSELSRAALDWAVAKCETPSGRDNDEIWLRDHRIGFSTRYYMTWSQGGPIIERERLNLRASGAGDWVAMTHVPAHPDQCIQYGDTLLIAAMRCYVASKLGDTIEIPDELMTD